MKLRLHRPLASLLLGMATMFSGAAALAAERVLPVPAAIIYPGEIIEDTLLIDRKFSPSALGRLPLANGRATIVGKIARRTLLPGRPIPAGALAEPEVVKRGVPVQIVFQEAGLTILATATSLQSGGIGDLIQVRNLDSGLIISGTVQADGTVRVGNVS